MLEPRMNASAPARPAFGYDAAVVDARAASLGLTALHAPEGPRADGDARPDPLGGNAVALLDLGLIVAEGSDAVSFLQSQLTNDVELMPEDQWRRFGFCSAKGRLQAIFTGWRADGAGMALALPLPMVEVLRRRLSMFVLRAKVRLHDHSGSQAFFGLSGDSARAWIERAFGKVPPPGSLQRHGARALLALEPVDVDRLGGGGRMVPRWLLVCPSDDAAATWSDLRSTLAPASGTFWQWLSVLSGVPQILPGTWECFVPQMVNLELVGGVSFRKGCYPGQEVVARSQYLGKLKRRMSLGHADGELPMPGADITSEGQTEACGQVVLAAASPSGGFDVLFESQTAALEGHALRVAGVPLEVGRLPYAIPAPEPVTRR
jgi:folate-binding protein YgfZ